MDGLECCIKLRGPSLAGWLSSQIYSERMIVELLRAPDSELYAFGYLEGRDDIGYDAALSGKITASLSRAVFPQDRWRYLNATDRFQARGS